MILGAATTPPRDAAGGTEGSGDILCQGDHPDTSKSGILKFIVHLLWLLGTEFRVLVNVIRRTTQPKAVNIALYF